MVRQRAMVASVALALLIGLVFALWRSASPPSEASAAAGSVALPPAAAAIGRDRVPAALPPALSPQREAVAAAEPRVFGQVVESGGAPLGDALVTLFDYASSKSETARTGADGAYDFLSSRGRRGLFHLMIACAGHGRLVAGDLRASLQPRRDVLAAGLVIRGRVVEAAGGRPVPVFQVIAARLPFQGDRVWDALAALQRQALPEALRTDAVLDCADPSGAFCVRGLAAGKFVLLVEAPGRQPVFWNGGGRRWDSSLGVEAKPEPEAAEQRIAFPPEGHAFVDVVDRASGLPVRDARVVTRLEVSGAAFGFADARPVPSEPSRFELPVGLDAHGNLDHWMATVSAPGYAPNRIGGGGYEDGNVFTSSSAVRRPCAAACATRAARRSPARSSSSSARPTRVSLAPRARQPTVATTSPASMRRARRCCAACRPRATPCSPSFRCDCRMARHGSWTSAGRWPHPCAAPYACKASRSATRNYGSKRPAAS